jgi:hypothetical protein
MSSFLADGSRRRKIAASFLAPVAAVSFLVATGTAPAQATSPNCQNNPVHYWGKGASGTGNYGTADLISTWSSWNVPNEADYQFSDEAVWSEDINNATNALEVGFFVGYGFGDITGGENHTNGQIPYYTLNNGKNEADYWGDFLPRSTEITMFAQDTSTTSFAYVDGLIDTNTGYVVNQPRWSFAQGETTETTATMGGGSGGDDSTMYWINSANNFEPWAYINTCADNPYWAKSDNGTDDFQNGGPN